MKVGWDWMMLWFEGVWSQMSYLREIIYPAEAFLAATFTHSMTQTDGISDNSISSFNILSSEYFLLL